MSNSVERHPLLPRIVDIGAGRAGSIRIVYDGCADDEFFPGSRRYFEVIPTFYAPIYDTHVTTHPESPFEVTLRFRAADPAAAVEALRLAEWDWLPLPFSVHYDARPPLG